MSSKNWPPEVMIESYMETKRWLPEGYKTGSDSCRNEKGNLVTAAQSMRRKHLCSLLYSRGKVNTAYEHMTKANLQSMTMVIVVVNTGLWWSSKSTTKRQEPAVLKKYSSNRIKQRKTWLPLLHLNGINPRKKAARLGRYYWLDYKRQLNRNNKKVKLTLTGFYLWNIAYASLHITFIAYTVSYFRPWATRVHVPKSIRLGHEVGIVDEKDETTMELYCIFTHTYAYISLIKHKLNTDTCNMIMYICIIVYILLSHSLD